MLYYGDRVKADAGIRKPITSWAKRLAFSTNMKWPQFAYVIIVA